MRIERKRTGVFVLLFLGLWLLAWSVHAETELGPYEPVIIRFWSEQGTAYTQIQATIVMGAEMQAPDIPNRGPATGCGWKTTGPEGYAVEVGGMIRVNEGGEILSYIKRVNGIAYLDLTEIRGTDLCQVDFYESDGNPEHVFMPLRLEVSAGTSIRLPAVPLREGYESLGWSTAVNASKASFKEGDSVTINQNINYYAVYRAMQIYSLRFSNNAGTSNYSKLRIDAYEGTRVTIPEVPKLEGYTGLGWAAAAKSKSVVYQPGQTMILKKNTKLFAVREKIVYCTATFFRGDGTTNAKYEALTIRVVKGTKVVLPAIPSRTGYVNMGWSTQKNASEPNRQVSSKVLVDKDKKYYAVQKKGVTVTLYNNSGSKSYGTISVLKGGTCRLPGRISKMPYTFMGWSTSPKQKVNPTYEVGESLTVNENTKLYACIFNRDAEPSLLSGQIGSAAQTIYDRIIFVGDSRMQRMGLTMNRQCSELMENIYFVAKGGQGLNWLRSEPDGGMALVMQILAQNPEKKTAVVFNLGINDLAGRDNYLEYMNGIAPTLQEKGCTLYYMSLNPLNNELCLADGRVSRPEEQVRLFNQMLASGLNHDYYRFIDSYAYLMRTGYGTDSGSNGEDSGVDDGLHYSTKTYKRIFAYVMENLAADR